MNKVINNSSLVSIVVPVYNAEKFIKDTVKTVIDQTYDNWELLLVDDCSTDKSVKIIKEYQQKDKRIKFFSNSKNSGAAISRNKGIEESRGRYIAFLDADDLWEPKKLEKQVAFMQEKDCAFSFTGYEFAGAEGKPNGKKVYVPENLTYKQALKNTTISTITVMFDMNKLSKSDIYMPNIRSEDTATWWNILRKGYVAYGLNEVLSYYRRSDATQSANKLVAAHRTWRLYRQQQGLGLFHSAYYFSWYAFNAVLRRV